MKLPPELVWDYSEPPADELWRLRRLAVFFPQFGRDADSVRSLYLRRAELDAPREVVELICMYARAWQVDDAA